MRLRGPAALLGLCASACWPGPAQPAEPTQIESCHYRLHVAASGTVQVDARCRSDGSMSFRPAAPHLIEYLRSRTTSRSGHLRAPRGELRYEVDLAQLAGRGHNADRAARVGDSFIAAMSNVLLVPEPLTTEIPVTVELASEPGVAVAAGLSRATGAGRYRLMAHEIPVATYFAFGKLSQQRLDIGGSALEVVHLDGPLDQPAPQLERWLADSAEAVRAFYGAFPLPRTTVMVIPAADRDRVVFGKVLPESEPAIALVVGQRATKEKLYGDWILIHELFHLGFPSFYAEGKWLDEGLATYYEPIIRVRAGMYTERELWSEFAKWLPQGLEAYTELGLEMADDFRGIYWGGALACLEADVAARRHQLDRGLEVGLRALRDAGGVANEVWALSDAIETIDHALGRPTLAPIAERHAARGSAFDLTGLLRDLGVHRRADGSVELRDDAPLARVRRAITAQR